ncbi:MAG: 2-dehydropantoate 2-reductase [Gammaproteobacteria bacterium]
MGADKTALRYGVIGVGSVGLTIATHLAQAGNEVSLYCRQERVRDNIVDYPLAVTGQLKAEAKIDKVYIDIDRFLADKPDVIMLCVKGYATPGLLNDIEMAGLPDGVLLVCCQNGIDVENQVVRVFGKKRTLRMVLNMGCNLHDTNNVVVHFAMPHFLSPALDGSIECAQIIARHLTEAGFETEVREDYRVLAFKKAVLNIALGTTSALTRMTMVEVMEEPGLYKMAAALVREGIEVGQGMGLDISDDFFDEAMTYLVRGGSHKPSMLMDIEDGKRTENEYLCGSLLRNAKYLGIELPVASTVYCLAKALEKTVRRARLRDIPR